MITENLELDQYFTTNSLLLSGLRSELKTIMNHYKQLKTHIKDIKNLEPSSGKGDIIFNCFHNVIYKNITAMEIDERYNSYYENKNINYINNDFLKYNFDTNFDIIIMNPPFTYTTEFLIKCLYLLKFDGFIVCICQDNTLKLTSNTKLLNEFKQYGELISLRKYTHENMFKDASVPVIIFTFHKVDNKIDNNNKPQIIDYYIDNIKQSE